MSNAVIDNLSFQTGSEQVYIGDTYYTFNIQLVNSDGNNVGIKFGSIVDFGITDSITNFCAEGYLIFRNDLDALESVQSVSTDVRGMPENAFSPYVFRGDGRDLLVVNIKPAISVDDGDPVNTMGQDTNSNFALNYIFSIHNTEDIISENKDMKLKKLYLHEQSFQILNEKNAYYTTGKIKNGGNSPVGTSNGERSIETGEAIRTLLSEVLSKDTNTQQTFAADWDVGSSKIFYSSPANNKAIDDLYYLLDYHVSSEENDYSPALLRKEKNNTWYLIPLTKLFKTAYYKGNESIGNLGGSNLAENFIIAKPNSGDSPPLTGPERNPQASLFANNFPDYSYAENFENAGMMSDASTFGVTTHMVHNYDPSTKTFSIDITDNNINDSMKLYKRSFVQTQKGVAGNSPGQNFPLNQIKSQNKNINHVFNPNPDQNIRLNSGRNKILLNTVFNNNTIAFRTRGNTVRQPGKFITLERKDFANNSTYDNKIYGTYLVVRVDHVFKNDQYYNYMVCTKSYSAEPTSSSSDVI